MFAVTRDSQVQLDFTVSATLALLLRLLLKPLLLVGLILIVVVAMQYGALGRDHLLTLPPAVFLAWFDFSMFTAGDADEMLAQEAAIAAAVADMDAEGMQDAVF